MTELFIGLQALNGVYAIILLTFAIIWWVLCIILFFKIWAMTNDVSKIKDMLREWLDLDHPIIDDGAEKEEPPKAV